MTEKKRYTMVNTNLVDNDGVYYLIKKEGHDFCQVFGENTAKAIVNELNNLYDMRIENGKIASAYLKENEQLKKAEILANHRGEMISFANSLIDDLGSETMKEMWDKFREEKYEEWGNLE